MKSNYVNIKITEKAKNIGLPDPELQQFKKNPAPVYTFT
jgi:hypothetical protein